MVEQVLSYAARHGIDEQQLLEMVGLAARFSKGRCNRRYKDWLFELKNDVVTYITPFVSARQVPKPGPGEFLVYEECEGCFGKGCHDCEGSVKSRSFAGNRGR